MVIGQLNPFIGGTERQCMKLSKALKKKGHEVKVVTVWQLRDLPRNEKIEGIPVERVGYPMLRFLGRKLVGFGFVSWLTFAWGVYRNLRVYDIVHVHHGLWPAFSATLAATWAGKPIVCKIANSGERFDFLRLKRKHLYGSLAVGLMKKRVDRFVWTSRAVFDDLLAMNIATEQLVYIPNGVEQPKFQRNTDNHEKSALVYLGSLTPKKNLSLLVEAIGNLPGAYQEKLQLKMLGDGPQKASLIALTKKYGLEDVIHFEGQIDDVDAYLRDSDVFVLPSLAEGLSNAALEAMSFGLPLILSLTGGNVDLIEIKESNPVIATEDGSLVVGTNGILTKLNCRQSLIEAIEYMIDHPSQRVEMGNRSREIIEAKYWLKDIVTQYESLYFQCCSPLAVHR